MLDIQFEVHMNPTGKARPRAGRYGMYTPKETVKAEGEIAAMAREVMSGEPPSTRPITLAVSVVFPIPPSYRGEKRRMAESGESHPGKKPDIDNVVKLAADAMNGIVYADDAQVCRLVAEKIYGEKAKLCIRVFD